jgi:predicted RNA-binding Zn ribbon-like protein
VNTVTVEFGRDLLGTRQAAARWLAMAGLLPADVTLTDPELAALVELREAIRGALAAHTAAHDDQAAASRLTVALARSRLHLTADAAGGLRLASADHDPFTRAIGGIASALAQASSVGTWQRLKSCPGHLCGWAFYDRSPAGQSRWCSMQLCGARAKMQAYRDRTRQPG